jgi:hypothetical protein
MLEIRFMNVDFQSKGIFPTSGLPIQPRQNTSDN